MSNRGSGPFRPAGMLTLRGSGWWPSSITFAAAKLQQQAEGFGHRARYAQKQRCLSEVCSTREITQIVRHLRSNRQRFDHLGSSEVLTPAVPEEMLAGTTVTGTREYETQGDTKGHKHPLTASSPARGAMLSREIHFLGTGFPA